MNSLIWLVRRNIKLYFKDKGMFFSSLITPMILLVLYVTFLGNVYRDSFNSALPAALEIDKSLINATVGGQLISSLLAVCCVTVAFCANLLMVQDKVSGAVRDIKVSPVSGTVVAAGYFCASAISTLIITFSTLAVCLVYLAYTGWYMSLCDVLFIMLDVFLLTLFGVALSSCINYPLKTQGQLSAVGTVVSAGYGFLCGAYMPISNFSKGLQNVLSFLPGTYGTSLLRNHALNGVYAEMSSSGFPDDVVDSIRDSIDCNLYFFGNRVSIGCMYAVLFGAIVLFAALYTIINAVGRKRTCR